MAKNCEPPYSGKYAFHYIGLYYCSFGFNSFVIFIQATANCDIVRARLLSDPSISILALHLSIRRLYIESLVRTRKILDDETTVAEP